MTCGGFRPPDLRAVCGMGQDGGREDSVSVEGLAARGDCGEAEHATDAVEVNRLARIMVRGGHDPG
jgi:hypothetical protein